MAVARLYNETLFRFANKQIELTTIKVMLLLGATFDPTETDILTTLSAFEVSGNGWPVGGQPTNAYISGSFQYCVFGLTAITNITATGGPIGPADALVVYDSTNNYPITYIDFEGEITALEGTLFQVIWNDRVIRWDPPE